MFVPVKASRVNEVNVTKEKIILIGYSDEHLTAMHVIQYFNQQFHWVSVEIVGRIVLADKRSISAMWQNERWSNWQSTWISLIDGHLLREESSILWPARTGRRWTGEHWGSWWDTVRCALYCWGRGGGGGCHGQLDAGVDAEDSAPKGDSKTKQKRETISLATKKSARNSESNRSLHSWAVNKTNERTYSQITCATARALRSAVGWTVLGHSRHKKVPFSC